MNINKKFRIEFVTHIFPLNVLLVVYVIYHYFNS